MNEGVFVMMEAGVEAASTSIFTEAEAWVTENPHERALYVAYYMTVSNGIYGYVDRTMVWRPI